MAWKRTVAGWLLAGFAAAPLAAAFAAEPATGPANPAEPPEREILLGGDYHEGAKEDSRALFRETGMNCVRITGGGYGWALPAQADWAKTLAEWGVKSYLQLGSHYPSGDFFAMKDAWLVDQDGKTGEVKDWAIRYDHSAWPMLSYAHQGFRDKLEQTFESYLKSFPPGPNLAGVILHNEPGYHWLNNRVFDYGAPNVAAFRAWLPAVHGDIATLNRRWGTDYADFAAVEPPKPAPEALAAWMDWRRFQVYQIADFMRWEADFIKRIRPDLERTTNLDGPTNNWYSTRMADIEAYNRPMDAAGIDIYPTQWTDRAFVPYAMDQLQGVAQGRPAHILECEVFGDRAGEWKAVSAKLRADLLRSELWTMLGHGADCVLLWGFTRGDNFSLTDGEFNPRVLVCRDVAAQVAQLGLGRFHRERSAVAVVLDPDAYIRFGALDKGSLSGGSRLDSEFHGVHAALAAAGFQADVIMAAQLPEVADRYRALLLPAMPMMDEATGALLRAFTENGGVVAALAPFAEFDRWGAALDAPGLGLPADADVPADGVHAFGKGLFARWTGGPGAAYINGADAGFPARVAAVLARGGIEPNFRVEAVGRAVPDVSVLRRGADRLVVVAAQGEKASAAIAARDVAFEIAGVAPKAAYAFPGTAERDGAVRSGPARLAVEEGDLGARIRAGAVDSALPVLLTDGFDPLLALEAPAKLKAGAAAELTVVVHNPSDAEVAGTLELVADGIEAAPAAVRVPAWGATETALPFTAPAATPRLVLKAKLTVDGADRPSVPVDVAVE